MELAASIAELTLPRGLSHLRDHLVRAADNTALRLSEASGRTLGNRYQHLEAAYAENQEVQSDLVLMRARGVEIPWRSSVRRIGWAADLRAAARERRGADRVKADPAARAV